MSFQTKIVQKTSGLNIANGTPSCVVSGSDTCDIRVSIYTDAVGGSQLWTETHSNVELGATGGVISLSLNSVTANWGFTWGADDTIYLQLELDQDGNGDFSSAETFARKLISTVPFAYYADRAGSINGLTENDLVQLKPGTTQTTGNTSNPIIDINEDGSGTPDLLKLGVGGSGNRLTLSNAGLLTIADDLTINGDALTTGSTTFNLLNTTATTINFGGAATTLNLAGGSGSTGCTINSAGDLTCSGAISGTGAAGFVLGGNSFGALGILGTNDANALAFETNNVERMRLTTTGGLILGATSSISDLHVQTGEYTSGAITMSASSASTTFTTSSSITLNAGDTVVPIGFESQARTVASTATGTSFSVTQAFGANVSGLQFRIVRRGVTVEGALPVLSLNRVNSGYTSQEWLLRVGGTSAGSRLFDIYSQTTGVTGLAIDQTGDVFIGATTNHGGLANNSRLFVYGGDNGANIDIMGDGSVVDEARVEVQSSDYSTSFASAALDYYGVNGVGTLLGYNKQYMGVLDFRDGTLQAIIKTGGNIPLRFATNDTEVGRFEAAGDLTLNNDLAVNGGDLTTTQTTFNLVNSTATTINFGGAATTMNIGVAGASGTLNLMGGSGSTGCTINGTTGALTCTGAITGSQSFIELGPSSAQAYTGANALINLNETGGSTPDLLNLTVGGSNRFNITNDGRLDVDTGTISSAAAAFSFAATINSQATGMRVALNSSPGSAVPVAGLNVPVTLSGTSALGHGISSSVTSSGTVSQYLNGGSFTSSITGGSISDARGLFSRVTNGGSSTVASIYGLLAEAVGGSSTGGTTNAYGVWGETNTASTGSGTVSNGYGFYSRVGTGATSAAAITTAYNYYGTLNVQSASITTGYGIYLAAADTGGGSLTSYTGLHIADQTSVTGTTGYGVYIAGAKTLSLFVDSGDSRFDGNLTTGSTSIDLFNTTATTINFGGAATAMTIGISGASGTLDLMGGYGSTGCTLNGTNGGWSCDGAIVANNGFTTGGLAYFGNSSSDYTPTAGNWSSTGSTLVLNALNYSVLAFHDNGSRVDFIRVGAGTMELGYNGGYGNPTVVIPGAVNIATASTGAVNIGTGATTQTLNFGTGAGAKTVSIGSNTSGSTTTIYAGDTASNGTFILTGVTKLNRNSYLCIGAGNGIVNYNSSCTSSSIRFKENVVNLNYGLEEIMALRPVFFNYKPDQNLGNRRNIGFIAEEVNEIIPEVTVFGEDGLVESLDYEKLVSLLTVGVQQLNTNIQALETNINSELASLRVSIENLATPDLSAITSQIDSQQLRISNLEARVENLEAGVISSLVLPGTAEFGELVITGKVNVKGQLLLSNKNIGITTIATGSTEKTITFAQGFPNSPVVIAIPTQSSIGYSIQDTTTTGFKIVLDAPAASDLQFNWFVSSGE